MFWELTPLRIAFTELGLRSKCQSWFGQKCPLLPDKDWFHFVYAKYGSRSHDWGLPFCHSGSDHCNPPYSKLTKPIQIWSVLPEISLQKIRYWGSGFNKSLSSLLKTWLELYIVWFASGYLSRDKNGTSIGKTHQSNVGSIFGIVIANNLHGITFSHNSLLRQMSCFLKIKIIGSILSDIWQLRSVPTKSEKFSFKLNQHSQGKTLCFRWFVKL